MTRLVGACVHARPRLRLVSVILDLLHTTWLIAPSHLDSLVAAIQTARVGDGPAGRQWSLPLPPPFQRHVLDVAPPCGLPCRDVRPSRRRVSRVAAWRPDRAPLAFLQVPLTPLLSRLDVEPLLMLYSALLCERRVIMVSRSAAVASSCAYAAVALMQPFEWMVRRSAGTFTRAPPLFGLPQASCALTRATLCTLPAARVHPVRATGNAALLLRTRATDRRRCGRGPAGVVARRSRRGEPGVPPRAWSTARR